MERKSYIFNAIVNLLANANESDEKRSLFILTFPVERIMKSAEHLEKEQLSALKAEVSKLLSYYTSRLSGYYGLPEKESSKQEDDIEDIRYAPPGVFGSTIHSQPLAEYLGKTATFSTPSEPFRPASYSAPLEGYIPQGLPPLSATIDGFMGNGENLSFAKDDPLTGGAGNTLPTYEPESQVRKPEGEGAVQFDSKLLRERDFTAKLKKMPLSSSYSAYSFFTENNLEEIVFEVLREIKQLDTIEKVRQPLEDMSLEVVRKQTEESERSLTRHQLAITTTDTTKHDTGYQAVPSLSNVGLGLEAISSTQNRTLNVADSLFVESQLNFPEQSSLFPTEKPCFAANEADSIADQEMRNWSEILRQLESTNYGDKHVPKKRRNKRRKIVTQKPDQAEHFESETNLFPGMRQVTDIQRTTMECSTYIMRLHHTGQLGAEALEFLQQLTANVSPLLVNTSFSKKSRYQIVKQIRIMIELCSKSLIKIELQRDGVLAIHMNTKTE